MVKKEKQVGVSFSVTGDRQKAIGEEREARLKS